MVQHRLPSGDREGESSHGNEPTHSEDGVDLTLIRWMLSLTPAERLQVLLNEHPPVVHPQRRKSLLSSPPDTCSHGHCASKAQIPSILTSSPGARAAT
jgi:hypothetical protein